MNNKQIAKLQNLADTSQYSEQGVYFLEATGVHMEAVKAIPQTAPQWAGGGEHGTQFSISLAKINPDMGVVNQYTKVLEQPQLFTEVINFPFWGSIHDKQAYKKSGSSIDIEKAPTAYDILAGLDSMYNDTFEDWCFNYGYDDDSRDAYKTYKQCLELDTKLKKVFTSKQMEALQHIN